MGHKLHENMFYQNLFAENMSFYQNLCCKSVVVNDTNDK